MTTIISRKCADSYGYTANRAPSIDGLLSTIFLKNIYDLIFIIRLKNQNCANWSSIKIVDIIKTLVSVSVDSWK